jgi:glycosyltransferase involved in cell wall biosynthesis
VEYRAWHSAEPDPDRPAYIGAFLRDERPRCTVAADAPTIAHLVPEHYPVVQQFVEGALISHTVWETDRLPAHWPRLLNSAAGVVVPCQWNREVFAAGGVTIPIAVVPHVVCDPVPGDGGQGLDLPDDVVVFYTIARWDPRKAPWLSLRAFLDAFTADDPVAFVIKTTHGLQAPALGTWGSGSAPFGTTSLEVARVLKDYPRPPHVLLEVWDVGDERIAGLHTRGDCFVSLAHGEGWGIGAFDACAYGNPVVTTGWSGPVEYLGRDAPGLVDYDLVPVKHHWHSSYSPDQRWAEPRIDHAAELLREVAADLDGARARAAPIRERVLGDYAPPVVAERFLAAVDDLST